MIYLIAGLINLCSKIILREFEIHPLFIIGGHVLKIIRYSNADSRQRKETEGTQTEASEGKQNKVVNLTCKK